MIQLSLFRGVHDTQPRPVTLEEVVTMMRTDQSVRDLTEKHRYARSVGDEPSAGRYKKMMTSFGVAARFEGGRQQRHIVELTGLSLVDIDHIPAERMGEVLEKVRGDEHTLLAYTTISGEGIRILTRYVFNDNVNDNCYPLRSVASLSPLVPLKEGQCSLDSSIAERGSSAPAEYRTNQKELSPFKGRSEAFRGLAKCQAVPSEGSAVLCATEADRERNEVKRYGAEGVKLYAEQYRLAFLQGNEYYRNLVGIEPDGQCKNIGRISTIAYDEELYYNPDATPFIIVPEEKKAVGRPKGVKSEKGRVKSCKVKDVETIIIRELERRGVVYAPGSHNRYISDACYMMNRYGVPLDDCTAWALDKFADYQAEGNDVAAIVRSCYTQTEEHGTARMPKAEKESRYASIRDIQDWLTKNNVRIRHNLITRKREISFNENVDDNCYPLRTTCSSPLKRDSAESTEYSTNQKELSPFKGDSSSWIDSTVLSPKKNWQRSRLII